MNFFIYHFVIKEKDFDILSLYGNISGYIGFFIGYSLFQVPNLILYLFRFAKEYLQRTATKKLNRKATALLDIRIPNKSYTEINFDKQLKRFNLELFELSQKFQELNDLMRA